MKVLIPLLVILVLIGCTPTGKHKAEVQSNADRFSVEAIPGGDLLTDLETGCQYIKAEYDHSSYTPRLDSDGEPMCGK